MQESCKGPGTGTVTRHAGVCGFWWHNAWHLMAVKTSRKPPTYCHRFILRVGPLNRDRREIFEQWHASFDVFE
jgi:hypothetical protein